ncbi:MAG TPA: serine hydrolase [Ktedonobacteraceae bacterium]|nr:serine hydrolase [Ktedonobacteraceae bacterium]
MTHQYTAEIAERIQRIEHNILPDPFAWKQDTPRTTLAERMAFYRTPGVSVAVVNNGEIEWARGYGVLEAGRAEPVTTETIFQVCSVSKHVAMVGTLRLAQEGVLDLDEDSNRYLTSWKLPANGSWQPRVTIRQLLGHTAGLSYNWFRGFRRGEATPTLLQVLEGQPPANTPPVRAALIPGSVYRYSGSHYSVLQQLLIDVTGKPFPELMRELVFEPLEMRNSCYDQSYPDSRSTSTAVGHDIGGDPLPGKWRVIPEMAGAGLWTTATDLAKLACEIQRAHLGKPTSFLKQEMVDQALKAQVAPSFGLGLHLEGRGATRRFGHGGSNIGYRCLSNAYVEHGMGAVVLTNSDDGDAVLSDLFRAIAQEYAWPDYQPQRVPVMMSPDSLHIYTGEYESRRGFVLLISQRDDRLFLEAKGQSPIELRPSSENTFFAQALDSEISFAKNEAGEVTGLSLKQEEQQMGAKKVR